MQTGPNTRCLITGATSGMGYELALALLRDGAELIIHGRSAASVAGAAERLAAAVPGARLATVHADLNEANGVDRLVAQLPEGRIDLLVNNAGAAFAAFALNAQGVERTVWINHFVPLMLARALIDRVSPDGVVATVSSASVNYVGIDPATVDITGKDLATDYSQMRAYGVSKLLDLCTMRAFGRGATGGPVAILVDPGGIQTDFARKAGEQAFLDLTLAHWEDCVTAGEAARQLLEAVRRDDLVRGGLYYRGERIAFPPGAHDEAFADRVLALTRDALAGL